MKILFSTVGGSHQPIVTAIKEINPDKVYFICSEDDPVTGFPGSSNQITGKGNIIKSKPSDNKPTLPNIPTQANLSEENFIIHEVPSDYLNEIIESCVELIENVINTYPEAEVYADFTGGTKSMTAGLTVASLEFERIKLQIITAPRQSLQKVSQSATSQPLDMENILFIRLLSQQLALLEHYSYSEAYSGINRLPHPKSKKASAQFHTALSLSKAFDQWDKFDHASAFDILKPFMNKYPKELADYIKNLNHMITTRDDSISKKRKELNLILDLWSNALRKVAQERLDDAVARMYRLIEWSAQWLLKHKYNINTSDIIFEQLPEAFSNQFNHKEEIKLGLFLSWELLSHLDSKEVGKFAKKQHKIILNIIKPRNQSILAHGFKPMLSTEAKNIQDWIELELIPLLLSQSKDIGIKRLPLQLPKSFPKG